MDAPLTPRVSRNRNRGSYLKRCAAPEGLETMSEACSNASEAAAFAGAGGGMFTGGSDGADASGVPAGITRAGARGPDMQLTLEASSTKMGRKRKPVTGITPPSVQAEGNGQSCNALRGEAEAGDRFQLGIPLI